jgi:hypothetical protein
LPAAGPITRQHPARSITKVRLGISRADGLPYPGLAGAMTKGAKRHAMMTFRWPSLVAAVFRVNRRKSFMRRASHLAPGTWHLGIHWPA